MPRNMVFFNMSCNFTLESHAFKSMVFHFMPRGGRVMAILTCQSHYLPRAVARYVLFQRGVYDEMAAKKALFSK